MIRQKQSAIFDDMWVIAFSDLLTLLLAFFVLRYALYDNKSVFPQITSIVKTQAPEASQPTQTLYEDILSYTTQALPHAEHSLYSNAPASLIAARSVVLPGAATLRHNTFGAQLTLQLSSLGFNPDSEISLNLATTLGTIARASHTKDPWFLIRFEAPQISPNYSSLSSGWEYASAKAQAVYRQLVDAGTPPERIYIEVTSQKNTKNQGSFQVFLINRPINSPKSLHVEDFLLKLDAN